MREDNCHEGNYHMSDGEGYYGCMSDDSLESAGDIYWTEPDDEDFYYPQRREKLYMHLKKGKHDVKRYHY